MQVIDTQLQQMVGVKYGAKKHHTCYPLTNLTQEQILQEIDIRQYLTEDYLLGLTLTDGPRCPFVQLAYLAVGYLNKGIEDVNVSELVVGPKTYEIISKYTYYWAYKTQPKFRRSPAKMRQSAFAILSLDISPCMSDAPFIKEGYLYIRKR